MSEMSEVSIVFGQNVALIEKARDIFTNETRKFIDDILDHVKDEDLGPLSAPRVKIKTTAATLETEGKLTGNISSQYAVARLDLCFKFRTKFLEIAELRFGIEFDGTTDCFSWQVGLVPASRYQWLDEVLWAEWQRSRQTLPVGAKHEAKEGAVVFVARPFGPELTNKVACGDVEEVLKFALAAELILVSEFAKQSPDEPVP